MQLQKAILMQKHDPDIFNWYWDDDIVPDPWGSILAPSPRCFSRRPHVVLCMSDPRWRRNLRSSKYDNVRHHLERMLNLGEGLATKVFPASDSEQKGQASEVDDRILYSKVPSRDSHVPRKPKGPMGGLWVDSKYLRSPVLYEQMEDFCHRFIQFYQPRQSGNPVS